MGWTQESWRIWGAIWGVTPDRTPYSPGLLRPPHFSFLGGLFSPEIGVHDDQFPDFSRLLCVGCRDSWRTPLGRLLFSVVPSGHTRVTQPPGSVVASRVPSICRVPSLSNVPHCAPRRAQRAPSMHNFLTKSHTKVMCYRWQCSVPQKWPRWKPLWKPW